MIVVVAVVVIVAVAVVVGLLLRTRVSTDGVDSFRRQIDALSPEARRPTVDQVKNVERPTGAEDAADAAGAAGADDDVAGVDDDDEGS